VFRRFDLPVFVDLKRLKEEVTIIVGEVKVKVYPRHACD
jgi:uncharacterized protein (UPF0216 family)